MRLRTIISTKLFWGLAGLVGSAGLVGLSACNGNDARLSGHFIGAAGQPVYLERVMTSGEAVVLDTVVTNDSGEFNFRVALPDRQPTIFRLHHADAAVPLLISPREKVSIFSLDDLGGYQVSGSPESELVWRLHGIMTHGATSLDSIRRYYLRSTPDGEHRERLGKAWIDKYMSIKRQQVAFIVEHASSLAAVYALYQRLPGDETLFNGPNDYIYYQMVADSVRRRYPDSRYVQALDREIASMNARREFENRIATEGIQEIGYPEIELPDMYGQKVKLSSLGGNVIVVDFWTAADTRGRLNNAEMKEMWDAMASRGLAIYQVSLDTDRSLWVNTVQEQKLPWTTVCDFRGEATGAVRSYNVGSLPANFVIDREGNIAGKNLFGDALRKKLEELL